MHTLNYKKNTLLLMINDFNKINMKALWFNDHGYKGKFFAYSMLENCLIELIYSFWCKVFIYSFIKLCIFNYYSTSSLTSMHLLVVNDLFKICHKKNGFPLHDAYTIKIITTRIMGY